MASGQPCASPPAAKVRKTTETQVASGLDLVVESTMEADIKYVARTLEQEGHDLASFVSSMLRDGELQKALARKKDTQVKANLGRKLPERAKKFKHLSPKYCKTFLLENDVLTDNPLEGAPDDFEYDAKKWVGHLAYALNVTLDTDLPDQHANPRYEGPLTVVFVRRSIDVQSKVRMQGLNGATFLTFGHFYSDPNNVKLVFARFAANLPIRLDCWPDGYFTDDTRLTFTDNDSMFEAMVSMEPQGGSQTLWTLFSAQHPDADYVVDNEKFNYPDLSNAAQGASAPAASSGGAAAAAAEGPGAPAPPQPIAAAPAVAADEPAAVEGREP